MTVVHALRAYRALWSRHPDEMPAPGITLESQLSTVFHRDLAARVWLERLAACVGQAISARPEFQTVAGHGIVRSEHDAERYMGDTSVVRYYFVVDVQVQRLDCATEHDRYTAWVRFLPGRDLFQIRREVVETREMRARTLDEEGARRRVEAANFEQLRAALNDREAIYIEKGVLRVRVSAIQGDVEGRQVAATIEEIPTPGLGRTRFHQRLSDRPVSLRWRIAGGYLTAFTDNEWTMGYGGWHLYFDLSIVADVVDLARRWPDDITPLDQYRQALAFVHEHPHEHGGPMKRVFLDREGQGGLLGSW